jgi:hypothetical protein
MENLRELHVNDGAGNSPPIPGLKTGSPWPEKKQSKFRAKIGFFFSSGGL